MESTEDRRLVWDAAKHPAPMTVAQLRERLAELPDDRVLHFVEYHVPEFSDWYTEVRHLAGVTDSGEVMLRSSADYTVHDEYECDEELDDGDEPDSLLVGSPDVVGPDGLRDWERDLLRPPERPAGPPVCA